MSCNDDLLEGQHAILSSGSTTRPAKRVDLKPFEETLAILREYRGEPAGLPAEEALQPRLHARSPYLKAYFGYLDKELDGHDPYWCGALCLKETPNKAHEAGFYCRLCSKQITQPKGLASGDAFKGKEVIGHFANEQSQKLRGQDLELVLRAILKVDGTFNDPATAAFHFANEQSQKLRGQDLELVLRAILKVDGTFNDPATAAFRARLENGQTNGDRASTANSVKTEQSSEEYDELDSNASTVQSYAGAQGRAPRAAGEEPRNSRAKTEPEH